MKKRIIILILLALLVLPSAVFADPPNSVATKSRTANMGRGISSVDGLGDLSSGNSQEVDSRGAASVLEYPKQIAVAQGGTLGAGTSLITGETVVYSIIFAGADLEAGDVLLVYDALTATGVPKFDVSIGTAQETIQIDIPGGVIFATGVFVDASDNAGQVTVIYDQ